METPCPSFFIMAGKLWWSEPGRTWGWARVGVIAAEETESLIAVSHLLSPCKAQNSCLLPHSSQTELLPKVNLSRSLSRPGPALTLISPPGFSGLPGVTWPCLPLPPLSCHSTPNRPSNTARSFLPQGFCTCCILCPECSPPYPISQGWFLYVW